MKIRVRQIVTHDFGEIDIDDTELDGLTIEEYLEDNIDDMLSGNHDCGTEIENKVQYLSDYRWVEWPECSTAEDVTT